MLPQRVLTLRGSALLSELHEEQEGGGGSQEAGIMEVMPPLFGVMPRLGNVEYKDLGGDDAVSV